MQVGTVWQTITTANYFAPQHASLDLGTTGFRWDNTFGVNLDLTGSASLGAGTTAAGTAPLYFQDGPLMTTPEDGAMEYEDGHLYFTNSGQRTVIAQTDGVKVSTTTVVNTVTETTIYTYTFPADALHTDERIVLDTTGVFTNDSAADDFTLRFKLAGATVATVSRVGGNQTNAGWRSHFDFTVRTDGASGTYVWAVEFTEHATVGRKQATITTNSIDTTAAIVFEVTMQWDNAKAGNTFSCTQGDLTFKH
jgi:hypothetical protein